MSLPFFLLFVKKRCDVNMAIGDSSFNLLFDNIAKKLAELREDDPLLKKIKDTCNNLIDSYNQMQTIYTSISSLSKYYSGRGLSRRLKTIKELEKLGQTPIEIKEILSKQKDLIRCYSEVEFYSQDLITLLSQGKSFKYAIYYTDGFGTYYRKEYDRPFTEEELITNGAFSRKKGGIVNEMAKEANLLKSQLGPNRIGLYNKLFSDETRYNLGVYAHQQDMYKISHYDTYLKNAKAIRKNDGRKKDVVHTPKEKRALKYNQGWFVEAFENDLAKHWANVDPNSANSIFLQVLNSILAHTWTIKEAWQLITSAAHNNLPSWKGGDVGEIQVKTILGQILNFSGPAVNASKAITQIAGQILKDYQNIQENTSKTTKILYDKMMMYNESQNLKKNVDTTVQKFIDRMMTNKT